MLSTNTPAIVQQVATDQPDDNQFQKFPNWSVGVYLYYTADEAIEAAHLLAREGRQPIRISIRLSAGGQRSPWRTVRPLEWIPPRPKPEPKVMQPEESQAMRLWDQIPKPEQESLLKLVAAMRLVGAGSLGDLIQLTLKAERIREQGGAVA